MSRDSETEHALHRATGPGAPRAPAHDAEHDPEASRRASLAGLRREAAGQQKDLEAQHATADAYSFAAVASALRLGVVRLQEYAVEIDTLIKSPLSEAGATPKISRMHEMFEDVRSELERLGGQIATQEPGLRLILRGDVLLLAGGVQRLGTMWERARRYAAQHGEAETLARDNPYHLEQIIEQIYEKIGLPPDASFDPGWVTEKGSALQEQAMQDGVEAALECARSLNMSMATGAAGSLQDDLGKLRWHLEEIRALIGHDASGKLERSFASQLREVVQAASALRGKLSASPALSDLASKSNLGFLIGEIQKAAMGR